MLINEIQALPSDHCLFTVGRWRVFYANAKVIPNILNEIGRLRAQAFSSIKGDSEELDLDIYDQNYIHLFVWSDETSEIISAARLGRSDYIIQNFGINGLYTTTLFNISPKLFEEIGPALEFGRTFVRSEYQKNYAPLLHLFKGICTYIVKNPQYRHLFGLISLGQQYHAHSQALITAYFQNTVGYSEYAHLAEALYPPSLVIPENTDEKLDLKTLSQMIKQQEQGKRSIPILIKEYLKFNTTLLAFGRDPLFGNCLDLLCLADLAKSNPFMLKRYMGAGVDSFLSRK